MSDVTLSVPESLAYAQEVAYLDGYAAGAHAMAEHLKGVAINKILQSRKPEPPPVQPESTEGTK